MSISDRIRPNSEAAPWVIEEVRKLEAEVERLKVELAESHERRREWARQVGRMTAEREDMEAEVERLKGKLMEEARWVYDTGQRAKDALAEVERLRSAISRFVAQYLWQDGPEIQELKALKERE